MLRRGGGNGRTFCVIIRQLIEQDHIEKRLMYLDAAVVFDEAELAKAVHKEADAGPGGADHLRQGFSAASSVVYVVVSIT